MLDGNPALKNLNVPSELKVRDKTILGTLYSEIVKNLELSRVSLSQQTPIIQVLDKPTLPLVNKEKSFLLLVSFSAFVSLLLTCVVLFLKFLSSSLIN